MERPRGLFLFRRINSVRRSSRLRGLTLLARALAGRLGRARPGERSAASAACVPFGSHSEHGVRHVGEGGSGLHRAGAEPAERVVFGEARDRHQPALGPLDHLSIRKLSPENLAVAEPRNRQVEGGRELRGLQRRDEKGGDARPRRDLQERAARVVREEDEGAPRLGEGEEVGAWDLPCGLAEAR